MTGWWQLMVLILVAANPATGHRANPKDGDRTGRPAAMVAIALAAVLVVIDALVAEQVLDFLDVPEESARIAAGAILALTGAQAVVLGGALVQPGPNTWQRGIYPLGIPLALNPGLLAVVLAFAANPDAGAGKTIAWAVPFAAVTPMVAWLLPARADGIADGVARLFGAVAMVLAAALIVSGVQDV